jgi:hypothetical protein
MASCVLSFDDVRAAGFPVYSLTLEEKWQEMRLLLDFDRSRLIEGGIVGQTMHGLALAWHYFPHAWSVRCGNKRTPSELFGDDRLLRVALERRAKMGNCETENDLRKALRTFSGTQSVSNFRPSAAAAIYDRYLPEEGGAVWDMSAGFGGRLLGAMACKKVTKYIGTDPATLTMNGLCEMRGELTPMVEYLGYPVPRIELHKIGSEDFVPEPESLSLCFTSSPYSSHERYSDEPTQSYIRFPSNEEWLYGYMRMTLDNCRVGLMRDGFLAVNIAGVSSFPTLHEDFITLAVTNSWRLVETLQLALSAMPGTRSGPAYKYEPIYVFQRNLSSGEVTRPNSEKEIANK